MSLAWAQKPAAAPNPVSFDKDLAPILYSHCAVCHHAGGSGPFPLISYEDAARHAEQIVAVTRSRYMPPWPPEQGHGSFAGDRSLTADQIDLFARWLEQDKPRGDPADLPPPPRFSTQWQMGQPDLVLRMPVPFLVPAEGADVFRNFIIPSGVDSVHYVRGFELRMSNPRVVHHANVVLDRTHSLRARDARDGQPGFPGMDVITEAAADNFEPDSHFLFWKPAAALRLEPDDMAWRLDPDTDLILNLHLQPTGKEETLTAEIGLYFASRPPTRLPMLIQLEDDGALKIPPGSKDFEVTDNFTLPIAAQLLGIYPHAHYLGKVIEAWATLPNGRRIDLIRIPDWDINWQATYDYVEPIDLPEGTKLNMRIRYDNSSANPRNPNRPPKLVLAGNRSSDEMGHVWLQLLPAPQPGGEDPRMAIQEAVMRRRLEKYPADFLAHYNLAAVLQMRGKYSAAASVYRLALKTEPNNATAHNSLAAALLMADDIPGAISEFRTTLALDPSYLNARYNLARALTANGDLADARAEYERFLQAKPGDAAAHAALGTLDFKEKNLPAALVQFREAVRLDPLNADAQANLGTLLAISGDLPAAKAAFEAALRADPAHRTARANLDRVNAQLAARH